MNEKPYSIEATRVEPDLRLITLIPSTELTYNSLRLLYPLVIILIIGLVIGGFFSIILSRKVTKPVLQLAKHMRTQVLVPIDMDCAQDDGVQILYHSYNKLVKQVQESIHKKMEYAQREKVLELNVLQAQMNPHFLCNSLNFVHNLATLHNENVIAKAVSQLCVFLRYNISMPNINVFLQRELDMLESYISLQNILCGDKIFFDLNIEVDSERTKIPKMLLQPLVENCIMHGAHDGFIEITIVGTVDSNKFSLIVQDTGCNCDIAALNASLQTKECITEAKAHGFGIWNVNQRIKMNYGSAYGLHYEHTEEGGTAAHIELPASIAVNFQ